MAISYVSQASAGATTVTIPTHQAGDMIVIFAFRDGSAVAPTTPAGYTTIGVKTGTNVGATIGYKIAASGSETSGTWTNATNLVCHVYRGAAGPGPAAAATASSATVNYPALTLMCSDGTSWVAGFGGHQSVNGTMGTAPSGMTNRTNLAGATAGAAGHDTNGAATSWNSTDVATDETAANYITFTLEILPSDTFVVNTAQSGISVPEGVSGVNLTMMGGGGGGGGGGIRGGTGNGKGGGGGGIRESRIMSISFVAVNVAVGQSVGTTTTVPTAAIIPTLPAGTASGDHTFVFQSHSHTAASAATPANWRALYKDVQVGNAAYRAESVTLPTTTVTTERLDVGLVWNAVSSKWRCMARGSA